MEEIIINKQNNYKRNNLKIYNTQTVEKRYPLTYSKGKLYFANQNSIQYISLKTPYPYEKGYVTKSTKGEPKEGDKLKESSFTNIQHIIVNNKEENEEWVIVDEEHIVIATTNTKYTKRNKEIEKREIGEAIITSVQNNKEGSAVTKLHENIYIYDAEEKKIKRIDKEEEEIVDEISYMDENIIEIIAKDETTFNLITKNKIYKHEKNQKTKNIQVDATTIPIREWTHITQDGEGKWWATNGRQIYVITTQTQYTRKDIVTLNLSEEITNLYMSPHGVLYITILYANQLSKISVFATQSTMECQGIEVANKKVCSGHGSCVEQDVCLCSTTLKGTPYIGDNCETEAKCINGTKRTCGIHGYCSQYECVCQDGYVGDLCEYQSCFGVSAANPKVCSGNGICQSTDKCKCHSSYSGQKCEKYNWSSSSITILVSAIVSFIFGFVCCTFIFLIAFCYPRLEKHFSFRRRRSPNVIFTTPNQEILETSRTRHHFVQPKIVQKKTSTIKVYREDDYQCPLTLCIMKEPVIVIETGQVYEREAIEHWLQTHDTDPMTSQKLRTKELVFHMALKEKIDLYREQNPSTSESQLSIYEGEDEANDDDSFNEENVYNT